MVGGQMTVTPRRLERHGREKSLRVVHMGSRYWTQLHSICYMDKGGSTGRGRYLGRFLGFNCDSDTMQQIVRDQERSRRNWGTGEEGSRGARGARGYRGVMGTGIECLESRDSCLQSTHSMETIQLMGVVSTTTIWPNGLGRCTHYIVVQYRSRGGAIAWRVCSCVKHVLLRSWLSAQRGFSLSTDLHHPTLRNRLHPSPSGFLQPATTHDRTAPTVHPAQHYSTSTTWQTQQHQHPPAVVDSAAVETVVESVAVAVAAGDLVAAAQRTLRRSGSP